MSLNQIDNAVGHAAAFGVQQDALLAVQLADHEQLVPPLGRQARKACARCDQRIDGIEIMLQVVELTTYSGYYSAAAWLFLLGNTQKVGTCSSAVIAGTVFTQIPTLIAEIVDDSFGRLPRLIQQFQISRIRDIGWCAGGIDGERSPGLAFWPIGRLHKVVE
jgi:hypothetical protein